MRFHRLRPGCALLGALAGLAALAWLAAGRDRPHVPTYGFQGQAFGVPVAYQGCGFHTGQDWFAPTGMPIFAVEAGRVLHVGPLWLEGPDVGRGPQAIVIEHGHYRTTYSHNASAEVRPGDSVRRGQKIGTVGDEGYSGLPHLHFEWVLSPWTGDWRRPFEGCEGYIDPGDAWGWL